MLVKYHAPSWATEPLAAYFFPRTKESARSQRLVEEPHANKRLTEPRKDVTPGPLSKMQVN